MSFNFFGYFCHKSLSPGRKKINNEMNNGFINRDYAIGKTHY